MIDPDNEEGPDADWYRSELDACRRRIAELEAEVAALRGDNVVHGQWDA